jgi:D-sedoheptulose 7-phosphate isomerase
LARPGDVVVALSTSGTSANVLAGLAEAQRLGLGTIGLAGYDGGSMARAGLDVCCVVASSSVHRIQETYVSLYDAMVRAAGR